MIIVLCKKVRSWPSSNITILKEIRPREQGQQGNKVKYSKKKLPSFTYYVTTIQVIGKNLPPKNKKERSII
jgi:hypothetical protein